AEIYRVAADRAHLARLPGPLLLAAQLLLEALVVHGHTLLPRQLLREVEGQAVGVVEAEGVRSRDASGPGMAGRDLLEHREGLLQRRPEALLLGPHDAGDRLRVRQ